MTPILIAASSAANRLAPEAWTAAAPATASEVCLMKPRRDVSCDGTCCSLMMHAL
jgi:hypothetical protein